VEHFCVKFADPGIRISYGNTDRQTDRQTEVKTYRPAIAVGVSRLKNSKVMNVSNALEDRQELGKHQLLLNKERRTTPK